MKYYMLLYYITDHLAVIASMGNHEQEFQDLKCHKGHKKKSYTLEFKIEAIAHRKCTSKQQACRKFGVDTKRMAPPSGKITRRKRLKKTLEGPKA